MTDSKDPISIGDSVLVRFKVVGQHPSGKLALVSLVTRNDQGCMFSVEPEFAEKIAND